MDSITIKTNGGSRDYDTKVSLPCGTEVRPIKSIRLSCDVGEDWRAHLEVIDPIVEVMAIADLSNVVVAIYENRTKPDRIKIREVLDLIDQNSKHI